MKHKVKNTIRRIISLQICSVVLACTIFPVQLSAQSLQRIFSTPAMRAELDRLRFQVATGVVIEDPMEESFIDIPVFTDGDDEEEVVYALGGSMRKSDGSYTVWVNDVAYDQSNLPENMELLSPFSRGQLRIRDSESAANYDVKPGQVLNLTTGQLYESYQYQAVLEAAAIEATILAIEEVANSSLGKGTGTRTGTDSGSDILDSAAVSNLLDAAQDL